MRLSVKGHHLSHFSKDTARQKAQWSAHCHQTQDGQYRRRQVQKSQPCPKGHSNPRGGLDASLELQRSFNCHCLPKGRVPP